MVDQIIYYSTGRAIRLDVSEDAYLGKITSVVGISELPTKNNQANIPYDGAPYARYLEGLAVLMDEEWIFFETR